MNFLAQIKPRIIILLLSFLILLLLSFNFFLSNNKFRSSVNNIFGPKPGSCLILAEKYCKNIKLISSPFRKDDLYAVVKVPKGTNLFSPVDGFFSDGTSFFFDQTSENIYPGVEVMTITEDTQGIRKPNYYYSLTYYELERQIKSAEIKKGQIISKISGDSIEDLGDYNLVFLVSRYVEDKEGSGGIIDNQKLKEIIGKE